MAACSALADVMRMYSARTSLHIRGQRTPTLPSARPPALSNPVASVKCLLCQPCCKCRAEAWATVCSEATSCNRTARWAGFAGCPGRHELGGLPAVRDARQHAARGRRRLLPQHCMRRACWPASESSVSQALQRIQQATASFESPRQLLVKTEHTQTVARNALELQGPGGRLPVLFQGVRGCVAQQAHS